MSITLYSSPMKYKDPTTGNYVDLVGISGNPGKGIASVVLNNDYTLTITFTDNTSTTVGPIRGEPGEDYVLTEQDKEDIAALIDAPVQDVQINGTSILGQDGVANVPLAGIGTLGVVKQLASRGITIDNNGGIFIEKSLVSETKNGANSYKPIVPINQHGAVFYGLAKAAGADMASISGATVGVYPEAQKSAIHEMLNGSVSVSGTTPAITALPGIRYVCGEVATLDITLPASGIVDVVFSSGSTATVLTITPPTGQTVKWANGFDPTSLDANTTYEINIADGLGVAVGWT